MSKLFLVSGERSGDLHAAELLGAFQDTEAGQGMEFLGLGGPELRERFGDGFEDWIEEAAVIGITEVLKKYGWFKRKFAQTLERIEEVQPEAVVFVDYPGFNLRLAKALRKKGFKGKLIYYVSPQVWAWNKGRIPKMAEMLDLMLCVFQFEKELYNNSGLQTEWVGHPMVEELEERRVYGVEREDALVGLFPGSRAREVRVLLPVMLEAAEQVLEVYPEVTFSLALASERVGQIAEEILSASSFPKDRLITEVGQSQVLMQKATAGWVASGTATLEAGFYGMPYALVYKVSELTYWFAKMVVKIPFIGIVNILADKLVVQEFIQGRATPENLAQEMKKILGDTEYRNEMLRNLEKVKGQLGGGGAHKKAAQVISDCLTAGKEGV